MERHLYAVAKEAAATHERAEDRWGTDFDDKNTLNDWAAYVNIYLARGVSMHSTPDQRRDGLLKAAGLLLGALERLDEGRMQLRHYDKPEEWISKA